ncbi:unnamed protein product [Rhizophagus irregularis]|nr:unnamed protein product [Rhizophagus irregularis]
MCAINHFLPKLLVYQSPRTGLRKISFGLQDFPSKKKKIIIIPRLFFNSNSRYLKKKTKLANKKNQK